MKDNRQNNMDSTDMDNLQMSNGNKRIVKIQDVKPDQLFKMYRECYKYWGQVIYTRKEEEENSKEYGVVPIDKRLYSFTVLSDTEVQLIDDEIQQSLNEVNCTGKCLEEDIKQQYTDSLPHTYNLRSKEQAETNWLSGSLIDVIPQSTKEIVNEVKREPKLYQWRTDSIPAFTWKDNEKEYIETEWEKIKKQKTAAEIERIHHLKTVGINSDQTEEEKGVFAYYDVIAENRMIEELEEKLKQLTDPDKVIDTQIYNSLEEIYKDMLPSGMTMEALYEVVKKVQEKLQKTIDNGMYLQKGEL